MHQQRKSLKKSYGQMSIQEEMQQIQRSLSKRTDKRSLISYSYGSIGSEISLEDSNPGATVINKFFGSDPNKNNSMLQETLEINNSKNASNRQMLLGSSQNEKNIMKEKIFKEEFKMEKEDFMSENLINHECQCVKFQSSEYCPQFCVCYNQPEICSKQKCCGVCYKVKQKRLPQILEVYSRKQQISNSKLNKDFEQIWVGKEKEKSVDNIEKNAKKKKPCYCRKSQCAKGYCECNKINEYCDDSCGCQLPCFNRVVPLYPQKQKKQQPVYLESSMGSNSSSLSNKSMKFDPFNFF